MPKFHAQTGIVTLPFQFHRGSRSISDLKPSDVVLLEDGVPRSFTIFEVPSVHLTLDLAVMFDVTNPRRPDLKKTAGFWDPKAVRDLAGYWSEAIARLLLDGRGASIRFSIYRFDQFRLQRLCQTTSDPKVLVDALHRLAGSSSSPQGASQDMDIPLPAGLALRNMERKAQADGFLPQPWSLAGALSVLKDSAAVAAVAPATTDSKGATAARALVIFSTGAEGTTITPEDLADQAISAGVAVYPVALPPSPVAAWILPYEGYHYDVDVNGEIRNGSVHYGGSPSSMWGPGGVTFVHDYTIIYPWGNPDGCQNCGSGSVQYLNYPFELLGSLTGGMRFEAVNHNTPSKPEEPTQGLVFSTKYTPVYSMTGSETLDVLERVKRHALARFSSTYTVGFVPSPSGAPRQHQLEVKLISKSTGKVTDGTRSATY